MLSQSPDNSDRRRRAKALSAWRFAERLDWRRPLTISVRYVHGADPGVEVRARGQVKTFAWDTAILDIVSEVTGRM